MIGSDIKTVQYGWPLGIPVVRKLEQGLWEIRSRLDKRIARVLCTVQGNTMILLHGFIKKSQKIAKADLALARQRKTGWGNNMGKHIGITLDDFLDEEGMLAEK
ncbi:MAG: type II toxin-antitoxin system RelE/ParE family toxin [Gammaproteobacteria bacterium]|nr:type II toxin-antitoxin system RelE/ParE family toxin [Gammaproteobacteria bacterium]